MSRSTRTSCSTDRRDRRVICYWNTRSYWPTAYHPGVNSLFVPYVENCLDMTSEGPNGDPRERRDGIPRPGSDPNTWAGLMKINMATGEMKPIFTGRAPSNGAVLTTAGNVVFWGDLDQKFRAFDAESGKMLWEQTLGGPIQNSTITYAVNGKQYVAVLTGSGALSGGLMDQAGIKPNRGYNASLRVRAAVALARRIRTLTGSPAMTIAAAFLFACLSGAVALAQSPSALPQGGGAPRADTPGPHIEDLVAGNRILAMEGVLDGMGHISVRHPSRADRFFSRDRWRRSW